MLVADYNSEGSAEEEAVSEDLPARGVQPAESVEARKSKRYLATAALLPAEIRAALEGRLEEDEEDEEEWEVAQAAAVVAPTAVKGTSSHGLLSMLPSARDAPQAVPQTAPEAVPQVEPDDEDDIDEGPVHSMFTMPSRRRLAEAAIMEPIAEVGVEKQQDSVGSARKRRLLESRLMQGDVSALEADESVEVADVRGRIETRTAEQLAATSEFTSEVRIAANFYNPKTGTNITTVRPSKLQRRRHQINSLAVSAAERELALLEQQSAGRTTKRQTQSKYGW